MENIVSLHRAPLTMTTLIRVCWFAAIDAVADAHTRNAQLAFLDAVREIKEAAVAVVVIH